MTRKKTPKIVTLRDDFTEEHRIADIIVKAMRKEFPEFMEHRHEMVEDRHFDDQELLLDIVTPDDEVRVFFIPRIMYIKGEFKRRLENNPPKMYDDGLAIAKV